MDVWCSIAAAVIGYTLMSAVGLRALITLLSSPAVGKGTPPQQSGL